MTAKKPDFEAKAWRPMGDIADWYLKQIPVAPYRHQVKNKSLPRKEKPMAKKPAKKKSKK